MSFFQPIRHNKKAMSEKSVLISLCSNDHLFPHFCTTKKRDCTIAVPLFEALALPLYPNKQHRAHADMYAHAHTHINTMCTARIYIHRGHQNAAMYWILIENLRDSE